MRRSLHSGAHVKGAAGWAWKNHDAVMAVAGVGACALATAGACLAATVGIAVVSGAITGAKSYQSNGRNLSKAVFVGGVSVISDLGFAGATHKIRAVRDISRVKGVERYIGTVKKAFAPRATARALSTVRGRGRMAMNSLAGFAGYWINQGATWGANKVWR